MNNTVADILIEALPYIRNFSGKTIQMDNGIRKIKVKVYVEGGKTGEAEITVGINTDPNYLSPTPTVGQILTVTSAP